MYRLAICDDDEQFLEVIHEKVRRYCEENGIDIKISCFFDSILLADMTQRGQVFDAYILDIEMGYYTGLDIVASLKQYADITAVILLTAYDAYAVEACGMRILKYMMKDRIKEELPPTLDKLFEYLDGLHQEKIYLIGNRQRFLKIKQREIIYIYKDQKNAVFVLTGGRKEKERLTLQKAYQKLDNEDMLFLDRGIILNLFHVKKITGYSVKMDDGFEFSAGQDKISLLKRKLDEYWRTM